MRTGTVVPAHGDLRFATGMASAETVNVAGLEQHLRRHVRGEVRFDKGSLAMYASDASNYRQVPLGVVVPRTLDDVVETMKACARYRAPVTCRGGGTSLSGETVNNAVIVAFAPVSLQEWFAARGGTTNPSGPEVVLWPDTFTNRLRTDVGVACVEAIEAAGWQVVLPQGHVCCGRPLYDYGFLDLAERYLHRVLDVLRDDDRAGTPVVGMEPSCLAVFKDELPKLLSHDDDARRLARNAWHFAEFVDRFDLALPRLDGEALMWGHCHQRATGGMDAEQRLLERMGLQVRPVSGGCCGLAGSWGFERGKYQISVDCGEQALLPAVREADDATVVVADGFSCSTQIADAGPGRRALHVAQVVQLAREKGRKALARGRPEDALGDSQPAAAPHRRLARTTGPLAAVTAGGAAALVTGRRRNRTARAFEKGMHIR
jgi:Fe-S oxidoreductase